MKNSIRSLFLMIALFLVGFTFFENRQNEGAAAKNAVSGGFTVLVNCAGGCSNYTVQCVFNNKIVATCTPDATTCFCSIDLSNCISCIIPGYYYLQAVKGCWASPVSQQYLEANGQVNLLELSSCVCNNRHQ